MTQQLPKQRFELVKKTSFQEIKEGEHIPSSDFSIINNNDEFLQFKFIEDEEVKNEHKVKPGLYKLVKEMDGVKAKPTNFQQDEILEDYDFTSRIEARVMSFFNKIPVYERYGIFPKRGMLLHGKPGVGKSQGINKISEKLIKQGDTAVILWSTSDLEASSVKSFIQDVVYIDGATKLVLIAEDIGGGEYVGGKMEIKASLLSLLDNMEQTFKIPTYILATTNYPENLLEVLTNRPQRFDDILEVKMPNSEQRHKLLSFFLKKDNMTESDAEFIRHKKYEGLSVAHLKEGIIRAAIYDLSLEESFNKVVAQSVRAKKDFHESKAMGIGISIKDDINDDEW